MVVAFDFETTKKPRFLPWQDGAYPVSFSIARSDGVRKSWLLNHPEATKTLRECVDEISTELSAATRIVAHNAKFDLHWLHALAIGIGNVPIYCTQVAEYMLTGQKRSDGLSLNDLAQRYGFPAKKDRVKLYWDSGYETDEIPANILNEYCEHDCAITLACYNLQAVRLNELNLNMLFSLEMEALMCFVDMEENGMLLNRELLEVHEKTHTEKLLGMDEELQQLLGIENISSTAQLSCGLYGGTYTVDGRVPGKRAGTTKKGKVPKKVDGFGFTPPPGLEKGANGYYSVSVPNLLALKARTKKQKHILELLFERSRLDQLNKTYFKGLLERIGPDNKVHPSLNQTVAVTGRMSCSNPNLQNQPRGNTGPVKECFITSFT